MYAAPKDTYAGSSKPEHKPIKAAQETKSLPAVPQSNKAAFEAWKAKVTVTTTTAPQVTVAAAAPHVSAAPAAAKTNPRGRPAPLRPAVAPGCAPAVAGSAWGNFAATIQQDDAAGAKRGQEERALYADVRPELRETYKR